MLYSCSVVFTTLVGKGFVFGREPPVAAKEHFGSTARSLFSLFKLMNGDVSVAAPICSYALGQVLFASFMIVSNWAILAILTSVVSNNMIMSSNRAFEEDEQ